MGIEDFLTRTFLQQALRRPEGRHYLLNQVADAEASSEGAIFDRVLARVDSAELRWMIRRHREDERVHAQLFRERLEAHGGTARPVPPELRIIDRLDRAVGGLLDAPIVDDRAVARAYLLLQVIEERSISQFPRFRDAFGALGDQTTARLFERVTRDEERHLCYCQAVLRRYLPDEATGRRELAEIRQIEARAFGENSMANLRYMLAMGYVDVGPAGLMAWLTVAQLAQQLGLMGPAGGQPSRDGDAARSVVALARRRLRPAPSSG